MNNIELKAWRTSRKLTRKALAELIGCSVHSIKNWETGRRSLPDWVAISLELYRSKEGFKNLALDYSSTADNAVNKMRQYKRLLDTSVAKIRSLELTASKSVDFLLASDKRAHDILVVAQRIAKTVSRIRDISESMSNNPYLHDHIQNCDEWIKVRDLADSLLNKEEDNADH